MEQLKLAFDDNSAEASNRGININETPEERETRRKEFMEELDTQMENLDVTNAVVLESREDRHNLADAIVGITSHPPYAVVYQLSKIIEAFMEWHGWDYDEAMEWYSYNTARSLPYISSSGDSNSNDLVPPMVVDDMF